MDDRDEVLPARHPIGRAAQDGCKKLCRR